MAAARTPAAVAIAVSNVTSSASRADVDTEPDTDALYAVRADNLAASYVTRAALRLVGVDPTPVALSYVAYAVARLLL